MQVQSCTTGYGGSACSAAKSIIGCYDQCAACKGGYTGVGAAAGKHQRAGTVFGQAETAADAAG